MIADGNLTFASHRCIRSRMGIHMIIGGKQFDLYHQVYIMGILNVTPDSFSDGGKWNGMDAALYHVEEMIRQGMSIVDIGGESTRPGYTLLSDDEEIARVIPVIEAVKARFDIPVSIDTYKAAVAQCAAAAGADLLNDIWGCAYEKRKLGQADERSGIAAAAAAYQLPVCLMHNRAEAVYTDYLADVKADLLESVEIARAEGVSESQIILDPGFGFAKSYEQNLQLMKHLEVVTELGYPVLLGTSRKSMIGLTLELPVTEREEGTIATTVMGIEKGCSIIRVHNVEANFRAAKMTQAILRA